MEEEGATGRLPLSAVVPTALACLANVAPHVPAWSGPSATLLCEMLARLAAPSFLLADRMRPTLLTSLVDVFAISLLHTHTSNLPLLAALLRSEPLLRAISTMSTSSEANDGEGGNGEGGNGEGGNGEDGGRFLPTAAWKAEWRSTLQLAPLLACIDAIPQATRPRLLSGAPQALRALRLKDHLPPPPPLQVRRYQPNEDSRTWLAQVIWGLVYERNAGWANPGGGGGVGDELFDARAVRLVQIMQVVPEEED